MGGLLFGKVLSGKGLTGKEVGIWRELCVAYGSIVHSIELGDLHWAAMNDAQLCCAW